MKYVSAAEMIYNGNLIKVHITELTLQGKSNLSTMFPENNQIYVSLNHTLNPINYDLL